MNRMGRTIKPGTWISVLLSLAVFGPSALFAQDPACKPSLIQKPHITEWEVLDGNQISCTVASDGQYATTSTHTAGFEWPKGSGKTAILTAGVWIVGRHVPSESLRTAVMNYASEYQPGPLLEVFNTLSNDDAGPVSRASDPRFRLYRVSRGDTLSANYREWPGDLGAPYVDVNANGSWDQGIDKPRLYGDQQIWCVINDVNKAQHAVMGATPPMGVEVRVLYWVLDQPGALANTMFIRWQIINRSDADYDSVYLALWDDVDLGFASDDLPGCDTTLDMGYVYNGDNDDAGSNGYGSTPPAIGIVFLQGPIVPGLPGDVARFAEGLKPGFRNLGMTSFLPSPCGTYPPLYCPPAGNPDFAPRVYNFLQGKLATGEYLTRSDSSIMKFVFSGDPVDGTGDLPPDFPLGPWLPQEVYMRTNTGPFSLARGDTQEVVAAVIMSQGTDRLQSVTTLKRDVALVKEMYLYGHPSASVVQVGPYQTIGTAVPLVGSASELFVGSITSITWTLAERPPGSSALIVDPLSLSTAITPDMVGDYKVLLISENTHGMKDTAGVKFTAVNNRPPVVTFLLPSTTVLGDSILVDGSGTVDPDNDPLSTEWVVEGGEYVSIMPPAYRTAVDSAMFAVVDTGTAHPRVYPYRMGRLRVTYRVSDGYFLRELTKEITVLPKATPHFTFVSRYDLLTLNTLGTYGFGDMQVFENRLWCWVCGTYLTPNFALNSDPAQSYAMKSGLHYVNGNRIFNARGSSGLDIYETDQHRSFTELRTAWRPPSVTGLPVFKVVQAYPREATLFMSCGTGGVLAYENYLSGTGTRVGAYTDGSSWGRFVVDGTNLYALIEGSGTVNVLDITAPAAITLAGSFAVPAGFARIRKSGDLLVLQNDTLLVIYDVSSQSAPVLRGSLAVPRTLLPVNIYWDFWVHGKYLVLGTQEGIYEYSIADPASPLLLESYITGHPNTHVYLDESRLVAAQWDQGGYGAPGRLEGLLAFDTDITGMLPEEMELPEEFSLQQNYPNPFNPTTGIRYQVSGSSNVRLSVYDVLGREVAVLVNERKAPGNYEVKFDAAGLSSGVYLYRLQAGNFVQTQKMILMK